MHTTACSWSRELVSRLPWRPFLTQVPIKGVKDLNWPLSLASFPCVLISSSCCEPAYQEGLCVKSAAACNSCSIGLRCACTRADSHSSSKASTRGSRRPLMSAITQKPPRTTCHVSPTELLGPLCTIAPMFCDVIRLGTRAQARTQYFWVTRLFGCNHISSCRHSNSGVCGGK